MSEKVQTFQAKIDAETLKRWNGCIRVWDAPRSAVDGAEVTDMIKEPIEVTVVEVQKDMMYGTTPQRYKLTYGNKEGWVLADAIARGE